MNKPPTDKTDEIATQNTYPYEVVRFNALKYGILSRYTVRSHESHADIQTTEAAATPTQAEPKRLVSQRGTWLNDTEHSAARTYHANHFHCHICIVDGSGNRYGKRCAFGLALWKTYRGIDRNNKVNQPPTRSTG